MFNGVFDFNENTWSLQPSERHVAPHKFQNRPFGPRTLVAVKPLFYAVLLSATSVLRFLVPAVFHFFSVFVNSAVTSTDQEQC